MPTKPTNNPSPRLQAVRMMTLVKTESDLQKMLSHWEENLLSGHVGKAVTKLEKDQRTLEKLFAGTVRQLLQLSRLRLDSTDGEWGRAASSGLPGGNLLGQALTQLTRAALTPKTTTRTRLSETTRSAVAAERFALGAADYGQKLVQNQAKNARNG